MKARLRRRSKRVGTNEGPFANTEPPGNASIRTGKPGVTLTASVQPARAADTPIAWSADSKLVSLSAASGKSTTITGHNTTNHAEYAAVRATAANGFYVTSHLYVEPAYIDSAKLHAQAFDCRAGQQQNLRQLRA